MESGFNRIYTLTYFTSAPLSTSPSTFSSINHTFWGTPIFGNIHIKHKPIPSFFKHTSSRYCKASWTSCPQLYQLCDVPSGNTTSWRASTHLKKYWSNWIISPTRGEHNKYLKLPPRQEPTRPFPASHHFHKIRKVRKRGSMVIKDFVWAEVGQKRRSLCH